MIVTVLKFGGTSLNSAEKRDLAATEVIDKFNSGYFPVVIVSAMGRKGDPYATDSLLKLIPEKVSRDNKRERDQLQACGEIISAVVFALKLQTLGYKSRSLTGSQAGIITDSNHGNARIKSIDPGYLQYLCGEKIIPVIAGFQGQDVMGETTTLGRGGSDTTASAVAAALKAESIEIFTDVDGIKTADPARIDETSTIKEMDYREVVELAYKGAKVIHPRAVEIAAGAGIPIRILSPGSRRNSSLVHEFDHERPITGLTSKDNIAFVQIRSGQVERYATGLKIFSLLAAENISVDFINIRPGEISFIVDAVNFREVENILSSNDFDFTMELDFIKLSAVGSGMTGRPGILARIVNLLSANDISIFETTDSYMTISLLIPKNDHDKALKILHQGLISSMDDFSV